MYSPRPASPPTHTSGRVGRQGSDERSLLARFGDSMRRIGITRFGRGAKPCEAVGGDLPHGAASEVAGRSARLDGKRVATTRDYFASYRLEDGSIDYEAWAWDHGEMGADL